MKRLLSTLIPLLAAYAAAAQFYHPGEVLEYRVSYKAKLFPNTKRLMKRSRATPCGTHIRLS